MADARSVVVTGASRGLGLATAAHLYRNGWTVLAGMRSPDEGMPRLRALTAAAADDPALVPIKLDVDDQRSVDAAAGAIIDAVGAPYGIVHNAGVAAVGCLEEMPMSVWQQIFATNFFGPVRLTRALLPSMREAARGRIVMVSSQGAILGMPGIGGYSAAKAALERWAEALSQEVAPFGLGVSVLVAGSYQTDILELTQTYADTDGPYAPHHAGLESRGRWITRVASSQPDRFAPAVARALADTRPFRRRAVGLDAKLLMAGRAALPIGLLQRIIGRALALPGPGALKQ